MQRYLKRYNERVLQGEYSRFIKSFHWDWMVTLTFSKSVTYPVARKHMKSYLAALSDQSTSLYAFWVVERGNQEGRIHCHALVGGTNGLPTRCSSNATGCSGC